MMLRLSSEETDDARMTVRPSTPETPRLHRIHASVHSRGAFDGHVAVGAGNEEALGKAPRGDNGNLAVVVDCSQICAEAALRVP